MNITNVTHACTSEAIDVSSFFPVGLAAVQMTSRLLQDDYLANPGSSMASNPCTQRLARHAAKSAGIVLDKLCLERPETTAKLNTSEKHYGVPTFNFQMLVQSREPHCPSTDRKPRVQT